MDEAWSNFMITGRVTDYLKYKESHEGSFDTSKKMVSLDLILVITKILHHGIAVTPVFFNFYPKF